MKNIRILSENFHFLMVKFTVYLNRLVFIMKASAFRARIKKNHHKLIIGCALYQFIGHENHKSVHIKCIYRHSAYKRLQLKATVNTFKIKDPFKISYKIDCVSQYVLVLGNEMI